MLLCILCWLWVGLCDGNLGLRELVQLPQNQELVKYLGTGYEVVHPVQVGQDYGRGLSTRIKLDGKVKHFQRTSFFIELSGGFKLYLDLELNTNLVPNTLVQLVYDSDSPPTALTKFPENCYYHATVRGHPEASAAFYTCDGIRGIIFVEDKILVLHPLKGNNTESGAHFLFHLSIDENLNCANTDTEKTFPENILLHPPDNSAGLRRKFIEMAIVLDRSLFEMFHQSESAAIASTIEMLNYADLFFRTLNTSLSLVFIEVWKENQIDLKQSLEESMRHFQEYSSRRMQRLSIDTAFLLSGLEYETTAGGIATEHSICTSDAVGLAKVSDIVQLHLTANMLAHLIGHNLGMAHDSADCDKDLKHLMSNNAPYLYHSSFSECSILEYYKTLEKGSGACLFNTPAMRTSICGNSILEESEECDCGSPEECAKHNPCCDPATCKLIKHAECSTGACCKNCKLLSSDHLCRPSKGECDIPEFCNGKDGQCPEDVYKRSGAICDGGLGYCYLGACPLLETQCQEIWGEEAENSHFACFDRMNIQGTPNGNCGTNERGELIKCTIEDSYCGSLHCSGGEKSPVRGEILPVNYAVNRISANGAMHECKVLKSSSSDQESILVQDGTKCGYQKICLNQTCTSVKKLVTGKCPLEEVHSTCSGHGICTNINTCACHEGWSGEDCSEEDEDGPWAKGSSDYYDSDSEKTHYGENEMQMSPNLAMTVIAACILLGLILVIILVIFMFHRNSWSLKSSSRR